MSVTQPYPDAGKGPSYSSIPLRGSMNDGRSKDRGINGHGRPRTNNNDEHKHGQRLPGQLEVAGHEHDRTERVHSSFTQSMPLSHILGDPANRNPRHRQRRRQPQAVLLRRQPTGPPTALECYSDRRWFTKNPSGAVRVCGGRRGEQQQPPPRGDKNEFPRGQLMFTLNLSP